MIRHRCLACHHMMDSSAHLVGLQVPCHVCGESLVVPEVSSDEPLSFIRASATVPKLDGSVATDANDMAWVRLQQFLGSLVPMSAKTRWLAAILVAVAFIAAGCAALWWWATRQP